MNFKIQHFNAAAPGSKVVGYANMLIEGVFVVTGLRLMKGDYGYWAAFPSRKNEEENKYYDLVYPIDKDLRQQIVDALVQEAGIDLNADESTPTNTTEESSNSLFDDDDVPF